MTHLTAFKSLSGALSCYGAALSVWLMPSFTILKRLLPALCLFLICIPEKGFTATSPGETEMEMGVEHLDIVPIENLAGGATISTDVESVALVTEVGAEDTQYYSVFGSGFPAGQTHILTISVSSSSYFTISADGVDFASSKDVYVEANATGEFQAYIAVKYAPLEGGTHSSTISHASSGATTKTMAVDGNASSLPVQWKFFQGKVLNGNIILEWTTASELNNSHFEIEVSKNPKAGFHKIGSLKSKAGNSKVPNSYSFKHPHKGSNGTLYFRLKQVDIDNTSSYSRMIAIGLPATIHTSISLAPNPLTDQAQLNILLAESGNLRIQIFNNRGTEVHSSIHALAEGTNHLNLPIAPGMPAGIYYLITEFKGKSNSLRFIKL